MKEKNIKYIMLFIILILACIAIIVFSAISTKENEIVSDIKVTYFNVGKGDAILIETQNHTILIDTGYEETSDTILNYLDENNITYIDYMIITHYDKDHVGGANWIIQNYEIGQILEPSYTSSGSEYKEYLKTLKNNDIVATDVTQTLTFTLDDASFIVYPPQKEAYTEEDNDFSLVIKMEYKNTSFLFAGDAEYDRIEEILNQNEFSLSSTVLKVPHHGQKEDNSEALFNAVSPQIAIITCSEEDPASSKVLSLLEAVGTKVYLTTDGTITCYTDGQDVTVKQ